MRRTDEPHDLAQHGLAPDAGIGQALHWAVAHAALAPSEHNSQPWRFRARVHDGDRATVDLLLDDAPQLPVVDPDQREAVLACGAALLNLRLALAGAGLGVLSVPFPDPARPALVARLEVAGPAVEREEDVALRLAIPRRGTHRGPFESTDLPPDLLSALQSEASREGAFATWADGTAREEVERLTAQAEQQLADDEAYRREVAAWSRSSSSAHHDGVPGYALGLGAVRSWLRPALVPAFSSAVGSTTSQAPAMLVLGSPDDSRPAVLRAGQAMQRVLLRARAEHVAASYLNAALHVPELRHRVATAMEVPAPQVVLRMGFGELVRPTPRRGVEDLLTVEHDAP